MSSARKIQRQEWADYLSGLAYFADIPIFTEDKEDIASEFERAIGPETVRGGKSGICVILMSVRAVPMRESDAGPVLEFLHAAHVVENVPVNRDATHGTLKTREEVAEWIAAYSHAIFRPVVSRGPFMLEPAGIEIADDSGLPSEDVFFRCPALLTHDLSQVATPVITNNSGTVSITCATPGAWIYYTTTGLLPTAGSTRYTAAFTPGASTIKARAFMLSMLTSEMSTLTIT